MKYGKLAEHLSKLNQGEVSLSFSKIEEIIGNKLPPSAHNHESWWNNNNHHSWSSGWMEAGWRRSKVDLRSRSVVFTRATPASRGSKGIQRDPGRPAGRIGPVQLPRVEKERRSREAQRLWDELFYKVTEIFKLGPYTEGEIEVIVSLMEWAYEKGQENSEKD